MFLSYFCARGISKKKLEQFMNFRSQRKFMIGPDVYKNICFNFSRSHITIAMDTIRTIHFIEK